jgi:hypothetical protein
LRRKFRIAVETHLSVRVKNPQPIRENGKAHDVPKAYAVNRVKKHSHRVTPLTDAQLKLAGALRSASATRKSTPSSTIGERRYFLTHSAFASCSGFVNGMTNPGTPAEICSQQEEYPARVNEKLYSERTDARFPTL